MGDSSRTTVKKDTKAETKEPTYNPFYALSSRIISIIVPDPDAPDDPPTLFHIMESVLTERSDVFKAVLSHEGTEKTEGKIEIKDSSPEMVSRLLEFLYTGEYTLPLPQWRPVVQIPMRGTGFLDKPAIVLNPDQAPPKRLFPSDSLKDPQTLPTTNRSPDILRNFTNHGCPLTWKLDKLSRWKYCYGNEDFLELAMCHAQMYCLGDRYAINDLRELSLHLLEEVLRTKNDGAACGSKDSKREKYGREIKEAIIDLTSYVYANTMSSKSKRMDPLRELLITFLVPNFPGLLYTGKERVYQEKLEEVIRHSGSGEVFLDVAVAMTLSREVYKTPGSEYKSCSYCGKQNTSEIGPHGSFCQSFQSMHFKPEGSESGRDSE